MNLLRSYLKYSIIVIVTFSLHSCEETETKPQGIIVSQAGNGAINSVEKWISSSSGRIAQEFNLDEIYRVEDNVNDMVLFGVTSLDNPNEALGFSILADGEVINPFRIRRDELADGIFKA